MRFRKVACLLALVLLFTGCAYFNTYYNADKLFKEAQEIGFDDQGRPKSNAVQKYNKVIKKCGVILTDYKDSKWADDALFLLAKSFYYKGNSYTLAIEKFTDILTFYPDSKYVADAHIYIARSNFQFNRKEIAYKQLQNFINNPKFKEEHPKAMLVLANYYLEDDDLIKADYYFQRITEKYKNSEQYQEAFFLQGKTLHISGDYLSSNLVFKALLANRVDKKLKLDARYYIALNFLLLEDPQSSYNIIKDLKKDEFRLEFLPRIQLLEARCLAQLNEVDDALELFEFIISENKNSLLAAEASYFLAETYFTELHDYDNAIEAYAGVKNQNRKSEYVELAISRSSVIGEIIQYNNPDTSIPTRDLVTQKLKLAEYYIEVLSLPDSALSIYNKICEEPAQLQIRLDSLIVIQQEIPDSVYAYQDTVITPLTTITEDSLTTFTNLDSVLTDSLSLQPVDNDSLNLVYIPEGDSLKAVTPNELDEIINRLNSDLIEYETEYIPFTRFVKTWIYSTLKQDSVKAQENYQKMVEYSPNNQYTVAAKALLEGKNVELFDRKIKEDTKVYEYVQNLLLTDPDSAYVLLAELSEKDDFTYYNKANFTLGLHYYEQADTSSAKLFFDRILQQDEVSEFNNEINRIYDGSEFIVTERLNYFAEKELEIDSLEVEVEIGSDSINTPEVLPDSNAETDSLKLSRPAEIIEKYDPPAPKTLDIPEEEIILEIEVLPDGSPGEINVMNEITIDKNLRQYIEATVKRWKFLPALDNGVPVTSRLTDQFIFKFE